MECSETSQYHQPPGREWEETVDLQTFWQCFFLSAFCGNAVVRIKKKPLLTAPHNLPLNCVDCVFPGQGPQLQFQ